MEATDLPVESEFYQRTDGGYVCGLCPHGCRIPYGKRGLCGSRLAGRDFLEASGYGMVTSLCVDPVEKKPLYHYRPGSLCLSVGGAGCNMRCRHCQNHAISDPVSGFKRAEYVSPEELAGICRREGLDSLAFTYNEPTIWFEYIRDTAELLPDTGIILVTNGFVNPGPMKRLCGIADAMNIDVKGFTDEFYRDVCGARLSDVLASAETAFREGIHTELTYLVIPGYNDSPAEIAGFCDWVRDSLSTEVPVHFNRFHPDNVMTDVPPTPAETLLRCRETAASAGLEFVYLGNIPGRGFSDTVCPGCGSTAVRRTGFDAETAGLDGDRCAACGHELNIRPRGRTAGSRSQSRG